MTLIVAQPPNLIPANISGYREIDKLYESRGAEEGPEQPLDFESEEVSLDIPYPTGVKLEGGWKLTPLTNPVITKKQVDSHKPGLLTPKCELMVERQAEVAQQIRFVLNLSGVKPPHVSFQIVLPGGAKGKASGSPSLKRSASSPDAHATQGTSAQLSKRRRIASEIITSSDKRLPTINNLLRELGKVADKWEILGSLLEVPTHELTDIRSRQQSNANCLHEMLKRWKKPSWEDLVEALQVDIIGEGQLASQLQLKYLDHAP